MFRRAAGAATGTTLGRLAMARALLGRRPDAEAEKVLRKVLATELISRGAGPAWQQTRRRRAVHGGAPLLLACVEKRFARRQLLDALRCGRIGPEGTEFD